MNPEHRKEQEEAHRRDFEAWWNKVVLPIAIEKGLPQERIAWLKNNDWECWLADDLLNRINL